MFKLSNFASLPAMATASPVYVAAASGEKPKKKLNAVEDFLLGGVAGTISPITSINNANKRVVPTK